MPLSPIAMRSEAKPVAQTRLADAPTAPPETTGRRASGKCWARTVSEADIELTKRALEGDRAAQRELATRLLDGVQREVAQCLLRFAGASRRDPRQEVRDLVQDVLVSLFVNDAKELRRWDPDRGRTLDSFVRLVARRRVARVLGQRRGNPWADAPTAPADLDGRDEAALTQRLEERAELDAVLLALYERMTDRDHELFDLLFVQEQDPDDVARTLEMTRGAVNAWSYRLRKQARGIAEGLAEEASPAQDDPDTKVATAASSVDAATTRKGVGHGR